MSERRNVAILVFENVEVLDFAGPFEVFSVAGQRNGPGLFSVFTVAETTDVIEGRNRFGIAPRYALDECPHIDILVVPGGFGTRSLLSNSRVLEWIRRTAASADMTLSVCTGALLLGQIGLLDGMPVTTHHGAVDELRRIAPGARVEAERRYIDNGNTVVSAGVAAGIDMCFHVLARLHGVDVARETAAYIEYDWRPN